MAIDIDDKKGSDVTTDDLDPFDLAFEEMRKAKKLSANQEWKSFVKTRKGGVPPVRHRPL